MGAAYFEEQKITQGWVFVILWGLLSAFFVCSIVLIFKEKINLFLSLIPFISILVVILIFRSIKLQTEITEEFISYRFFPLQISFRKLLKKHISHLQMRTYDPVGEYGGWGIRVNRQGRAYTINGKQGISITLKSEKNILIGTARPQEVEQALKENHYL